MKTNPLVSIIVPTFNRAHTLERTLESICAQTLHDYEIIVVDDGSTDQTRTLVESTLKGTFFRYIHQSNSGVAKARNTGIEASQGKYLAFCDSDDFWLPQKLEKQLPLFRPETALVYSDCYLFEDAGRPKGRAYEFITPRRGWVYADLLRKNFIATSSAIVKKSLLDKPFTGHTCEDWQMWLSVAKKGCFDFVDEPLAYYYEHGQGLSKSKITLAKARLEIRRQEIQALPDGLLQDKELVKSLKRLVQKDTFVLRILDKVPEAIMKKIDRFYYASGALRRTISKTIWSS